MNLDWNGVRYFVTLVEKQTLTAAAQHLDVQHSTVSRQIVQLEESLGLRLFDRIGKRYLLTEDGTRIYHQAKEIFKDMHVLQRMAHEQLEMRHTVIISAPPFVTRLLLLPHITEFHRRHPNIHLDLRSEAAITDLHDRQADIALRIVRPKQQDLTVRRLLTFAYRLYAHQQYLKHHTREQWCFVRVNVETDHYRWFSELITDDAAILLSTNDFAAVKQIICDQVGIGLLPDFAVFPTDYLQEVSVNPEIAPAYLPAELYLVMHEDVRHSAAVRAVTDFCGEYIGKLPGG